MRNFDLTRLFGSKTRVKILEKFFLEFESGNDGGFHMRALSRDLGEQINSIKRELDNLEELNILKSKEEAKKKYFYLNKNFFLIEEFKNIFLKTYNPSEAIRKFFKDQEKLELVIINEALLKRLAGDENNAIDIFLIGEINKILFNEFLARTFFNRKIRYAIITKDDFERRLQYSDKVILNIIRQSGNVFLKDNLGVRKMIEIKK